MSESVERGTRVKGPGACGYVCVSACVCVCSCVCVVVAGPLCI